MKGADGHSADSSFSTELFFQAFAHLPSSLVGKGHSRDFGRFLRRVPGSDKQFVRPMS